MYTSELLLTGVELFNTRLLVRAKHLWLRKLLDKAKIAELLSTVRSDPHAYVSLINALEQYSRSSRNGWIRASVSELLRALAHYGAEPMDMIERIVRASRSALGSNFLISLLQFHPLLAAISLIEKCTEDAYICVLEPVFEVEDHEVLEELRSRGELPYRNFDILVLNREAREIVLIELKTVIGDNIAHSLLGHLASFLEKVADHAFKVFNALRSASFEIVVAPYVILMRYESLPKSLYDKLYRILKCLEEMNSDLFRIRLRVQNVEKLLNDALAVLNKAPELKYGNRIQL